MGEVPGLVKFLAVLNYLGAALMIIAGIALLFGFNLVTNQYGSLTSILPIFSNSFIYIAAAVLAIIGILFIFIARGLWMGKNWARIISIVFYVLGLLGSLSGLAFGSYTSLIPLVINAAFGGYLAFSKKVKEAFTTSAVPPTM